MNSEEDDNEQLQKDYSMEMERWRNSCLSKDVNNQNEEEVKVIQTNKCEVVKSGKIAKKTGIVKSNCHKSEIDVRPNPKIQRIKNDVAKSNYNGDLSPGKMFHEPMKHGHVGKSSSESEESEEDFIVREEQCDNHEIVTIEKKESIESKENRNDISQDNSVIDIEGDTTSVTGEGEHESQGELTNKQMQKTTWNSSMMEGDKSVKYNLKLIDSQALIKEREWVKKMADARNINTEDYHYKVLKKMMLDAYYQDSTEGKITTKNDRNEQKGLSKSESNADYVGPSVDDCSSHKSARKKCKSVDDNQNSSDLSITDETSIQSRNILEASNFASLTKAAHWRKQIIASTKPRNNMNEPLFRSKYT